jgi:hypothetical protein
MLRRPALVLSILIAVALAHGAMAAPYSSVEAAVSDDPPSAAGSEVNAAADRPSTDSGCAAGVAFTRGVRYDDDEADTLDAATPPVDASVRHAIVAFLTVRGSGSEKESDLQSSVVSSAMCFAAEHGLVVFNIRFREGKDSPKASKAVAAGLSWIVENADLYGGNVHEIVPVGYGDAGSNLFEALLAGHAGLSYDNIAGLVFVSASLGVREGGDAGPNRRKLTEIPIPIILAWSRNDGFDVKAQNESMKKIFCDAGHCPRTAELEKPGNAASVFDLDGSSRVLHERLRQLISQLDARGLP